MKITPSHAKRLNFQLRTPVLGGLLLCAALSSSALTVGRMRGAAWLGQPLDVSIQVQYDETESLSALCFEAEVFHADARQDTARVRVSVESAAQAQTAQVRVQSSAAVDEPVVSVYLREGCVSKSSRRYVLLTEIPGEAVPSAALTSASVPAPKSVAGSVAPRSAPAAAAPRPAVTAPVKPAAAPAQAKPQGETVRAKPQAPLVPRKPPVAPQAAPEAKGKPQLKLDPLSSLSERVAQLEDVTLAAHTAEGDRDALRLKKMEESVQALLALSAKNDRSMTELRERLQKAESEKYDNPLVYGLVTLLLAALGATGYFWRRQQEASVRQASNGWHGRLGSGLMSPRAPEASAARPVMAKPAPESLVPAAVVAAAGTAAVAAQAVAPQVVAPEQTGVSDVDLDDLMAALVHEDAALPVSEAAPSAAPVEAFPALSAAPQDVRDDGPAEAASYHEFPPAAEVHIDVSHLSLTPVEPPAATAPPEVLLDFEFPEFEKKAAPEGEGAPASRDEGRS